MIRAFSIVVLALFVFLPVLVKGNVSAQFNPLAESCKGINTQSDVCRESRDTDNPVTGSDGVILRAANLLTFVAGVAAVVIIVISGIGLITSQGDAQSVKNNRNAIIYSAVGIVVILLSRTIVLFIINRVG